MKCSIRRRWLVLAVGGILILIFTLSEEGFIFVVSEYFKPFYYGPCYG
jgi:hypothetical protein